MTDSARELLREASEMLACSYSGFADDASETVRYARLRDDLCARITALLSDGGGDGWMPMVSAPLDGTEIELLIRHHEFWTALKVNGRESAERCYQAVCKGHWIDHNGGGWTWHGLAGAQVGWRLPAPPTDNAKGKR